MTDKGQHNLSSSWMARVVKAFVLNCAVMVMPQTVIFFKNLYRRH